MASPAPVIRHQFFDANGDPLAGGLIHTYLAGTTTRAVTYSDPDGLVPNTNPIVLDGSGYADIYLGNAAFKFVLMDADEVVLWTRDDVNAGNVNVEEVSSWAEHALTDGQGATALAGETIDFALFSSAIYEVEVIRGTTVIATGRISLQTINGTDRVREHAFDDLHGITFSLSSRVGTVATLQAAADSGPGGGTIKLSRRLVPA